MNISWLFLEEFLKIFLSKIEQSVLEIYSNIWYNLLDFWKSINIATTEDNLKIIIIKNSWWLLFSLTSSFEAQNQIFQVF